LRWLFISRALKDISSSIQSLLSNTETSFDFLVLDNGSTEDVRTYLKELNDQGSIDYLVLSSRNLGVEGGLKILANTVLGKYIAYTNDDVFYYPGWLQEHLKIMNTFPDVGMVSGAPVGIQTTLADLSRKPLTHYWITKVYRSLDQRTTINFWPQYL